MKSSPTQRVLSAEIAFSLVLLLSGSFLAAPAGSQEAASGAWSSATGDEITFDVGSMQGSDGLSLQMSGKSWYEAMEELGSAQLSLNSGSQVVQQPPEANAGGGGSVLGNPDEIARQSNNPLGGDFILWLNFVNFDVQQGDITNQSRYKTTHLLQPVIPIRTPQIGENWIFVNRPTVLTIYDQEVPERPNPTDPDTFSFDNRAGFGDMEYFALLGTSTPTESGWWADNFGKGDTVMAGGFTTRWPTGKSSLSENVYAAGPAATAAYVGQDWTFAFLFQHWWDYADQNDADDFNFSRLQLFYFKSFPGGWQIGGSPKITADWDADSDDRWTVPIGLAGFKTVLIGDTPVKFGLEFRPSLTRPNRFGTDFQVEFTIIPVTPNFVAEWFK